MQTDTTSPTRLEWTLRLGAFMCFVGHGAFGIMTKEAWVPYFGVVGIGREMAFRLMPWVGAVDIAMGCLVLWRPRAIHLWWMVLWALWTASLRPLSGEPVWEMFERAGNYGAPAALLVLAGALDRGSFRARGGWRSLFAVLRVPPLTPARLRLLRGTLAAALFLLLAGHGALGVIGKPGLVTNLASVTGAEAAARLVPPLGWAEVGLGAVAAVLPFPPLLVATAAWKALTEALFVTAGFPIWEWIERGGSYTVPLALAMVLAVQHRRGDQRLTL